MPSKVRPSNGGRNTSACGAALAFGLSVFLLCRQRTDSGTRQRIKRPTIAGAALHNITARHESVVTGYTWPNAPISATPRFDEQPSSPARNGREAFDHDSAASDMQFGHTPPMPRLAISRTASSCGCVSTYAPAPETSE
jgi:hypothetical protein